MNDFVPYLPWLGALLGLACLVGAFRTGRRKRLIDDLPTSKTSGVFIGLVELKGTAESAAPLASYLAEHPCVHYSWTVAEHWSRTVTETYTDSDGKTQTRTRHESGWATVANGGEMIPFYLQDDCGVVLIRPEGAKIEPALMFQETVGIGDPLYYGKGPQMGGGRLGPSAAFHRTRHSASRRALRGWASPRTTRPCRPRNRVRRQRADVPYFNPFRGAG